MPSRIETTRSGNPGDQGSGTGDQGPGIEVLRSRSVCGEASNRQRFTHHPPRTTPPISQSPTLSISNTPISHILLLSALALRLPLLSAYPFREDEAIYSYWALHLWQVDPLALTVWPDKPPLGLWLMGATFQIFGATEQSARLLNVAASLLTVAVVGMLARRLWGNAAGMGAALLLALNPYAVSFAPTAYLDTLLTLGMVLALAGALTGRPFLAGLALAAAIMTKQQGLLFVPLILAALWLAGVRRPAPWGRFLAGMALLIAPILYWDSLRWAVAPSPWDLAVTHYGGFALAPLPTWPERATAWATLLWYMLPSWVGVLGIGYWVLGIRDWGLGTGDWGLGNGDRGSEIGERAGESEAGRVGGEAVCSPVSRPRAAEEREPGIGDGASHPLRERGSGIGASASRPLCDRADERAATIHAPRTTHHAPNPCDRADQKVVTVHAPRTTHHAPNHPITQSPNIPIPQYPNIQSPILLWCAAFLLFHLITTTQVWDRYLLPLAPALALLGGWAVSRLRPGRRGVMVGLILAVMLPVGVRAGQGGYPIGGDHGDHGGLHQAVAWLNTEAPVGSVLYHRALGWQHRFYFFDPDRPGENRFDLRWYPHPVYLADNATKSPHLRHFLILPDWAGEPSLAQRLAQRGVDLRPRLQAERMTLYELVPRPGVFCDWCVSVEGVQP